MIDAFDWYTVLALGIASVIIAAVLFGTGFPSRKHRRADLAPFWHH